MPELRADSRYNLDTQAITERFSIGVDIITVIAETPPDGCITYEIMSAIDDFAWYMSNVPGVQSVITLPMVAKIVNAGWNEGTLKWRVLSRNTDNLVQSVSSVDTSSGLLNADCSVMPVMMFSEDHKAETISRIVSAVKNYRADNENADISYRLATGNVGRHGGDQRRGRCGPVSDPDGRFLGRHICFVSRLLRPAGQPFSILVPVAIAALLAWFVPEARMVTRYRHGAVHRFSGWFAFRPHARCYVSSYRWAWCRCWPMR